MHADGIDLHLSGRLVPGLKIHHVPAQKLQRIGIVIDADFPTDAVGTGERAYFDQIGRDVALFRHGLLHDFQHDAAVGLGRGRAEQGTERTGGSALLADHFAEIFFGNAQFKDGPLLPFHLDDLHVFGLVHKPFGDKFHKIFHSVPALFGEGKHLSAAELFGKTVFTKHAAGIVTRSLSARQHMRAKRRWGFPPFSHQRRKTNDPIRPAEADRVAEKPDNRKAD